MDIILTVLCVILVVILLLIHFDERCQKYTPPPYEPRWKIVRTTHDKDKPWWEVLEDWDKAKKNGEEK